MPTISDALRESSEKLRVPMFDERTAPRAKIAELEDYTLRSAHVQGDLAHERLETLVALAELRHKWDHLDGWQAFKRSRTEKAVEDAKRQINPQLYDQIQDLEWTVKRLSEEIDRLERDSVKVSRAYTMMTGT